MTSSSEQTTALERELAVLHLWDEGIIRPESLGEQVVDALMAFGWRPAPRVVSTVAELDALPVGTVVRFDDGDVWRTAGKGYVQIPANDPDWVAGAEHRKYPATVLWVGGTE